MPIQMIPKSQRPLVCISPYVEVMHVAAFFYFIYLFIYSSFMCHTLFTFKQQVKLNNIIITFEVLLDVFHVT